MAIPNRGSTLSIGSVVTAAQNEAAFAADTFQVIGGLNELGEISGERGVGNVANLNSGELEIFPTSYDPGTIEGTFISDPSDTGQATLETVAAGEDSYNFVYELSSGHKVYFTGFVTKANITGGDHESSAMLTVGIARRFGRPITVAPE